MTSEETHQLKTPLVAPFGTPVDRDAVQEVWDTFIVPTQSDDAPPQSVEERILMAILRAVYQALPEGEEQ